MSSSKRKKTPSAKAKEAQGASHVEKASQPASAKKKGEEGAFAKPAGAPPVPAPPPVPVTTMSEQGGRGPDEKEEDEALATQVIKPRAQLVADAKGRASAGLDDLEGGLFEAIEPMDLETRAQKRERLLAQLQALRDEDEGDKGGNAGVGMEGEKTGAAGSEDVESESDSSDYASNDNFLGENEKKEKKRSRGRQAVVPSLAEATFVIQAVAKNNFLAAPFGKVAEWEAACVEAIKKGKYDWSVQRVRKFVQRTINDYNAAVKKDPKLTGNKSSWMHSVQEDLDKIVAAVNAKEASKDKKARKARKKIAVKASNDLHRQEVKTKLEEEYGGPAAAASALKLKKSKRPDKVKEEGEGDDFPDGDREGEPEEEEEETSTRGTAGKKNPRKRTSKTDLLAIEASKEQRKLAAEENRKAELEYKRQKLALDEQRLKMEHEERASMMSFLKEAMLAMKK